MSRKFIRTVKVAVGDRVFTVRANFQVEKNLTLSSNKAQVVLYNLSDDSRGYVEHAAPAKKGLPSTVLCRIMAGYDGEAPLIFVGHITNVFNGRSGPDITTTVECGDGELALTTGDINLGFKGGVDEGKIARACIDRLKAFGLKEGFIEAFKPKLYRNGFSYAGSPSALLATICKNQGLQFSVQDTAIQVTRKGQATREPAVVLNAETGLIGFPTKTNGTFQVKSLLEDGLRPGRQVYLDSAQLTLQGYFLAQKVTHVGDSQEGDYASSVEGKSLG